MELAKRLIDVMDTFDPYGRDVELTEETVEAYIELRPEDIIKYLLDVVEEFI